MSCIPQVVEHTDEDSRMEDVFDDTTVNSGASVPPSSLQDKVKRPPPRKRFKWTEDLRYASHG